MVKTFMSPTLELKMGYLPFLFMSMSFRYFGTVASAMITNELTEFIREHTLNGDHSDAHQSTFSHSSKEGSPSKEVSTEDSPKKDKKKKKGLRTPSFLKKKKEKKKSTTPQPA
uniref:SFRICE_024542 n=1 Tax=Spodoptera frugiperda TaxID=7108 RepID=A0A2H1V937_SPOFR